MGGWHLMGQKLNRAGQTGGIGETREMGGIRRMGAIVVWWSVQVFRFHYATGSINPIIPTTRIIPDVQAIPFVTPISAIP